MRAAQLNGTRCRSRRWPQDSRSPASWESRCQAAVACAPGGSSVRNWKTSNSTKAWLVEHPLLEKYTPDAYVAGLPSTHREARAPRVVLFPHTYQVRDFAPRLATALGTCAGQRREAIGSTTANSSASANSSRAKSTPMSVFPPRRPISPPFRPVLSAPIRSNGFGRGR